MNATVTPIHVDHDAPDHGKPCSICGTIIEGWGCNAEPVKRGRCCQQCNSELVIPAWIMRARLQP